MAYFSKFILYAMALVMGAAAEAGPIADIKLGAGVIAVIESQFQGDTSYDPTFASIVSYQGNNQYIVRLEDGDKKGTILPDIKKENIVSQKGCVTLRPDYRFCSGDEFYESNYHSLYHRILRKKTGRSHYFANTRGSEYESAQFR